MNVHELVSIFGSYQKALEIFYLLSKKKQVIRHGFYDRELKEVELFCKMHSLYVERSRYRVVHQDKGMYSNYGALAKEGEQGMYLVYISRDHLLALKTCLYETRQDHYNTGLMLGYPPCCSRFASKEFSLGNFNPVHVPTNPYTNLTLRDADVCLLSHFPCNSECQPSIDIAKERLLLIESFDKKLASSIFLRLNGE